MIYTARIKKIFDTLYAYYGPQGWWPLTRISALCSAHPRNQRGYHPLDYHSPLSTDLNGQLEICIGAILTQNTSWIQVEKALTRLQDLNLLTPTALQNIDPEILKEAIKPSGYFNQKAKKIKAFMIFYSQLGDNIPSRHDLLNIWGIGPETADSMLLYAFHVPVFVIDAYTRRIFSRIFAAAPPINIQDYHQLQKLFFSAYEHTYPIHSTNPTQPLEIIFNEYHALLVEHAKRHCQKKPLCPECPLFACCDYPQEHKQITI